MFWDANEFKENILMLEEIISPIKHKKAIVKEVFGKKYITT